MPQPTFFGFTRAGRVATTVGLTGIGMVLGWFLPALLRWALDLPWIPFAGPLRLLNSIPDPWLRLAGAGFGGLAGGWLAVTAIVESLALTITDQQVEFRINSATRVFPRAQIAAAFLDGRRLVLLDPAGRELAREKPEASGARLAAGFRAHGYPWMQADPYLDRYRLWVPQMPGLPEGANALLSARARALAKKRPEDVAELGREVGRLGVVVRDEGTRQYWRPLP
jgi:hypothetical protein